MVAAGGALLAHDGAVDRAWVERVVVPLALDRAALAQMGAAAARIGLRDADERLADLVVTAHRRSS